MAGILYAVLFSPFRPGVGFEYLIVVFAATLLGGIGRPYGAMLGAVFIGLAMNFGSTYLSANYTRAYAFIIPSASSCSNRRASAEVSSDGAAHGWAAFFVAVATIGCIYGLLTLGLNVHYGYTGLLNFGHVAFFAAGAYASAIVTMPPPSTVTNASYVVWFDLPMPWGSPSVSPPQRSSAAHWRCSSA